MMHASLTSSSSASSSSAFPHHERGGVLYIHGFLSSPLSNKVSALRAGLATHFSAETALWAPDVNLPPRVVDDLLKDGYGPLIRSGVIQAVIGSSFGGFYAARLSQMFSVPAILINPCVQPWRFVKDYIGEQTVYGTDRVVTIEERFLTDLEALEREVSPAEVGRNVPSLMVLSQADEVLDYHEAERYYAQVLRRFYLPTGDHRISDFATSTLPTILSFLDEVWNKPTRENTTQPFLAK